MAKVTIEENVPQFKPLAVNIVVESEDELKVLYAVFNASVVKVIDTSGKYEKSVTRYFNTHSYENSIKYKVWKEINDFLISKGLIS